MKNVSLLDGYSIPLVDGIHRLVYWGWGPLDTDPNLSVVHALGDGTCLVIDLNPATLAPTGSIIHPTDSEGRERLTDAIRLLRDENQPHGIPCINQPKT